MPEERKFDLEKLEVSTAVLADFNLDVDQFVTIESNGIVAVLIPNKGESAHVLAEFLRNCMTQTLKLKGSDAARERLIPQG